MANEDGPDKAGLTGPVKGEFLAPPNVVESDKPGEEKGEEEGASVIYAA